jgi:2-keto-4-pentenoate hydratase/2-oxohepta-3-ene-1,7-dioic acid hydratase in catechol pathway
MKTILSLAVVVVCVAVLSSLWLLRPMSGGDLNASVYDGLSLAPPEQAVTLAVTAGGAVLLVTRVDRNGVVAVDVSAAVDEPFADAIAAYAALGQAQLAKLYDAETLRSYTWSELGLPVAPLHRNIAAGTNYGAHAEEVGMQAQPFLFPKLSRPSAWNSAVRPGVRLDYEVELCAVPLSDYRQGEPVELGYLLCGDYTDRWLLVRDIDLDGESGRTGFTLAKGGDSYLPVGPLLVIPWDENFFQQLEISLYLNGKLRQRSAASDMIWSPRELLEKSLADCESLYLAGEQTHHITDCDKVSAGTLLLTGTPGGVLFRVATLWNPWAYLRAGDVVTGFGTYLGYTRNEIAGP